MSPSYEGRKSAGTAVSAASPGLVIAAKMLSFQDFDWSQAKNFSTTILRRIFCISPISWSIAFHSEFHNDPRSPCPKLLDGSSFIKTIQAPTLAIQGIAQLYSSPASVILPTTKAAKKKIG